jgi:hypothetical protein
MYEKARMIPMISEQPMQSRKSPTEITDSPEVAKIP